MKLRAFFPIAFVFFLILFRAGKEAQFAYFSFTNESNPFVEKSNIKFIEMTQKRGILHYHRLLKMNSKMSNWDGLLPINASVAVVDLNEDGLMDLFFSSGEKGEVGFLYLATKSGHYVKDELWLSKVPKNHLSSTMGAFFFDFENDGDQDLFLLTVGCQRLLKNERGHFIEASNETGVDQFCIYGSSVAFFDYNKDGFTDVYIGVNLAGTIRDSSNFSVQTAAMYPKDRQEEARSNILLVNQQGVHFSRADQSVGLNNSRFTWWTAVSDFNDDTWADVFIANDFSINNILINKSGVFDETTESALGHQFSTSNMSAEIGDVNNDGKMDIFVSNISRSTFAPNHQNFLYIQSRNLTFKESAQEFGVHKCGWAWGAKFFDANRDGNLDLVVTNGWFDKGPDSWWYQTMMWHSVESSFSSANSIPPTNSHNIGRGHRNCLFIKDNGKYVDLALDAGLTEHRMGRGVAVLDIENDGDEDFIISNANSAPFLYVNESNNTNSWIRFDLKGRASGTDAFGVKIFIELTNGEILVREKYPTNGFSAQSDPRVFFGLGEKKIQNIKIQWPSGKFQNVGNLKENQDYVYVEPK